MGSGRGFEGLLIRLIEVQTHMVDLRQDHQRVDADARGQQRAGAVLVDHRFDALQFSLGIAEAISPRSNRS